MVLRPSCGTEYDGVFLNRACDAALDAAVSTKTAAARLRLAARAWGFRRMVSLIRCPVSRSTSSSAPRNPSASASPRTAVSPQASNASATPHGWMSIRVNPGQPGTQRHLPFEHGNPVALNGDCRRARRTALWRAGETSSALCTSATRDAQNDSTIGQSEFRVRERRDSQAWCRLSTGIPLALRARFEAASRPNSISQVLSGCGSSYRRQPAGSSPNTWPGPVGPA